MSKISLKSILAHAQIFGEQRFLLLAFRCGRSTSSLTTVMRRAMPPIIECNIFSVFLPFHSKPCIHLYLLIFRLEALCCPEHHFFSNQKWVRIHLSKVTRRNFSNPAELPQRTASTDNKRFCQVGGLVCKSALWKVLISKCDIKKIRSQNH